MGLRDTTPIVPNTTMQIYTNSSGVDTQYKITPISGYVLHNKGRDRTTYDSQGNVVSHTLGFTTAATSCFIDYDFTTHEITLANGETVTVYGEKEFFTVPIEDLPEEGIVYGGGTTPKPEIMSETEQPEND